MTPSSRTLPRHAVRPPPTGAPGRVSPSTNDAVVVDRLLKKLRYADPDLASNPQRPARPAPAARRTSKPFISPVARPHPWRFPWLWTVLGVVLALALTQWPYARACGVPLAAYVAAVGLLVVISVHALFSTWSTRRSVAHVVALLTMLGALLFIAEVMAPRVGYASTSAAWVCGGGS